MADARAEFSDIIHSLEESDSNLIRALDARASAVQRLRELCEREPDEYFRLPQDHEIIARARELAGVFPDDSVDAVFREVLSASARIIAPREVTYLGPEGSFSHVAARAHFGSAAKLRVASSVQEVFDAVTKQSTSYGVVPLETSSDGAITATLNGLVQSDVKICAELTVAARYHLVARTDNANEIEKIYGPSPAVAACANHLRIHWPRATVVDVPSTEVATKLAKDDPRAAAVATAINGNLEGLTVVRERIEDTAGTEARFAIIGNELPTRTGNDRTVLAMAVADKPGSLHRSLQPFSDRGINLTRLESRPSQDAAWRYVFFVELDGHITDRPITTAVEEIRSLTKMVKVLGSYPRPQH